MKKIFLCLIFLMIASVTAASVFAADIDNVNLDNDSISIVDNQNGVNGIDNADEFVLVDSDDSASSDDDVLINSDDSALNTTDLVPVNSDYYISDNPNHFASDKGAFDDFFSSVFNNTNKRMDASVTHENIITKGIFGIFDPLFGGYDIILVDPVDPNNIPEINFNDYTHSNLDNLQDVTFGNFGDATLDDLQ